MKVETKAELFGTGAGIALLAFYFATLTFVNSWDYALAQFQSLGLWVTLLSAGFGVQVYLFTLIRGRVRENRARMEVAATGGISAVSMVACCLHRVTDIIPILGLSVASVFLLKYQSFFLALGLFSNLFGIAMLLKLAKENMAINSDRLARVDMDVVKNLVLALAIVVLPVMFLSTSFASAEPEPMAFTTRTSSEGGVTIDITPLEVGPDAVRFDVQINTHQGNLGFDMLEVAELEDSQGRRYRPVEWQGSAPGGHHRSGVLIFPGVDTDRMELTLRGIYGVPERIFTWELVGNKKP